MSAQQGQAAVADGGGAALKVGDRVVVVECDRAPSTFYPIGATGTVKRIDCDGDYWIDFDAGFGIIKRADGSRVWCAIPERLRKKAAPKDSGKLADVLALIDKQVAHHQSLAQSDAYSAQEAPKWVAASAAIARLVEAHRNLIKAVRAFADGDMSVEVRDRLFLSKHDGPEQATFAALCEANDEAEAALRAMGETK